MSWVCSSCHKEFAKANQSHMCEVVALESIFLRKDAQLIDLYHTLIETIRPVGVFTETTSRKAITLYSFNKKAFLIIEPKKAFLDVYFFLGRKVDEFPVFKIAQVSRNKFAHYIRIQSAEDIDRQVIKWARQAYDYISGLSATNR
jgi:hypothetical protein